MIINFNNTVENGYGEIEFLTVRGISVRKYPVSKLDKFVSNKYNINEEDLTDYIDENWLSVTQDFYNAMNQTEHIANTKPQQNRGI